MSCSQNQIKQRANNVLQSKIRLTSSAGRVTWLKDFKWLCRLHLSTMQLTRHAKRLLICEPVQCFIAKLKIIYCPEGAYCVTAASICARSNKMIFVCLSDDDVCLMSRSDRTIICQSSSKSSANHHIITNHSNVLNLFERQREQHISISRLHMP